MFRQNEPSSLQAEYQKGFNTNILSIFSDEQFLTGGISTGISSNQLILPFFHNLSRLSIVPQFVHPRKHSNPLAVPLNRDTPSRLIFNANERVSIDGPALFIVSVALCVSRLSLRARFFFIFSLFLFVLFFLRAHA